MSSGVRAGRTGVLPTLPPFSDPSAVVSAENLGSVCSVCRNHLFPPGPVGLVSSSGGPRPREHGAWGPREGTDEYIPLPPTPPSFSATESGADILVTTSSSRGSLGPGGLGASGRGPGGLAEEFSAYSPVSMPQVFVHHKKSGLWLARP